MGSQTSPIGRERTLGSQMAADHFSVASFWAPPTSLSPLFFLPSGILASLRSLEAFLRGRPSQSWKQRREEGEAGQGSHSPPWESNYPQSFATASPQIAIVRSRA
jgi:hypothetical protein